MIQILNEIKMAKEAQAKAQAEAAKQ